MNGKRTLLALAVLLVGATAVAVGIGLFDDDEPGAGDAAVQQFGTERSFEAYVAAGRQRGHAAGIDRLPRDVALDEGGVAVRNAPRTETDATGPSRIAESNVQVEGLDEPDIVKTDGERFYYAPRSPVHPGPRPVTDAVSPVRERADRGSYVIGTEKPADPEEIAGVNASGRLLQTGETLVVFDSGADRIVAFDVSDPDDPVETWTHPLEASLLTAREAGGQLYVVTETPNSVGMACPIEPLGDEHVECGDVYAPERQTSADATYTAFSIDAASGDVEDSVSFVGTGTGTVVYMSENGLYITYDTGASRNELLAEYVQRSDLVPGDVANRVREIQSYDISERSKRVETEMAIERWLDSLPEDRRSDRSEAFDSGFRSYLGDNRERVTRTGVLSVGVDGADLTVGETATVPGEPLNQFAVDEYEGTLRITTTIPRTGDAGSTNALYVLDSETLDREDAVTGLGEDQRVYSVRYVGDRGYVVTFRQIDPFYVIDFEDPTDPEKLGELELPGFSSYMHSVDNDTVLGIGREAGRVKAALFDVTEPTEPAVADDLVVDEWRSGVADSHHAFLIDRRHELFFLPAGTTGYVVGYADGELSVVTTVETRSRISRARYVDDYLYVFAGGQVLVYDQTDWERTATLELTG